MSDHQASRPHGKDSVNLVSPLAGFDGLVESLYTQSWASRWNLSRSCFNAALESSIRKRFSTGALSAKELEEYLATLHLEDLALSSACAEGSDSAWEYFIATYRSYLRAAARSILRGASGSEELADSLFADLYGLVDGKRGDCSLFRYFHGRSALKTWLRAVLAQRHIDVIRAARRFESLPEADAENGKQMPRRDSVTQPGDPHRDRYIALFTAALQASLNQLERQDKDRLRLYYAEQQTLAEIGRCLGEHESSVSRHLDRIRRELRNRVEAILSTGRALVDGDAAKRGLSDAEIAFCFEYASADAPIDLDKLFPAKDQPGPKIGRREP
jgi:RNA polymerase sigma factor (sigma-70 family)